MVWLDNTNTVDVGFLSINSRIKVSDDYGTIRYLGEVKGYQGEWVGIEWDNHERGKHNGVVDNIQYFETKSSLTSGSFVRPAKITVPESLSDAIGNKYNIDYENDNPVDIKMMKEAQKFFKAPIFEIVGMEKIGKKQSCFEHLLEVSLSHSKISTAGNLFALKNIVNLELTSSLIGNWIILSDIVKQLTCLNYLNLGQNRLELPSEQDILQIEPNFRHVKSMSLRNCGLESWNDVLHIARLWPYIESLDLQSNGINQITSMNNNVFKNLINLDLQKNNLNEFNNDICLLGTITSLNKLILMENNITKIEFPFCEFNESLAIFVNLEELHLFNNPIKEEISAFNELDKLACLKFLSYGNKQLCEFDEMFSKVVAMVTSLKVFNKMEISKDHRRGAEYEIWKTYGFEWLTLQEKPDELLQFKRKYRIYPKLIAKYGDPDESLVRPAVKKSKLININIKDVNNTKTVRKRVPANMSIHTLQSVITKLFKTGNLTLPKLCYVDGKMNNIKVDMDNISKTLDYYSIQEDDIIIFE